MSDTDYDNWNKIPFDTQATPQEKADEFDLQYEQNQKNPPAPAVNVEIK